MRDGRNGYAPSDGILGAREAVAAEYTRLAVPTTPGSRADYLGDLRRTRAGADRDRRRGRGGARALADLPALHGGARQDRRGCRSTTGPIRRITGCRISTTSARRITPATRVLVVIDPNNPTGAIYPDAVRRELIAIAEQHGLRDSRRRGLRRARLRRAGAADGGARSRRARSFRIRACRRPISRRDGGPGGWPSAARRASMARCARSRSWPTGGCAVRRRCSMRSRPR